MMNNWYESIPNFGKEKRQTQITAEDISIDLFRLCLNMISEIGIEKYSVEIISKLDNLNQMFEKAHIDIEDNRHK